MPHGTPDWGLVGPRTTTYGLDDLGEHAARVGSPNVYDRRGETIWQTEFAEGLEGVTWYSLAAAPVQALWTQYARKGAYHVWVECGTTDDEEVGIEKYLPYPVASGLGLEFSFNKWFNPLYIGGQIHLADATGEYWGAIRYDDLNDELQWYRGAADWVMFAEDLDLAARQEICHTMKLVVDFRTQRYVRALIDNMTYSMIDPATGLGYPMRATAVATPTLMDVRIWGSNRDGALLKLGIDVVIVTQNEP